MKKKLFSWGDDFYIKNEFNEDVYFVDGKAFSLFGRELSFQDMSKNGSGQRLSDKLWMTMNQRMTNAWYCSDLEKDKVLRT